MACRPQPYRLDPQKQGIPDDLKQNITNADEMFQILFEDLNSLCLEVDALAETTPSSSVSTSGGSCGCPQGPLGRDGDDGESWPLPTPGPPGPPGPAGGGGGGGASMPLMLLDSEPEIVWPMANPATAHQNQCSAYHDTTQALTTATWTVLNLNNEDFDNSGMHDTVTNNSRVVVPTTGKYFCVAQFYFAASGAGTTRQVALMKNNAGGAFANCVLLNFGIPDATYGNFFTISSVFQLNAGDYLEPYAYQDSGGNLDIGATAGGNGRRAMTALQMIQLG